MDQDQATRPSASGDPAIQAILQRTATLRGDDLVTLARSYDAACAAESERLDRRRVVDLARQRAQRPQEFDALEMAVTDAVASATTGRERRTLHRLGVIDRAERAILDAVLAIALRDRLGASVAVDLAQPFEAVR
jgi:hypothetical protein